MFEDEVRTRIRELEDTAAGREFTQIERNEYAGLEAKLREFEGRRNRLRKIAQDPRRREETWEGPGAPRHDENRPEHIRAAHDAGLRAINRHDGILRAEAADTLDRLVRNADPLGHAGRYLEAVADPSYNSAFGKLVADPMHGHVRFSREETAAVQKVSAVEAERGMVIGTDTAGGFAVPFLMARPK